MAYTLALWAELTRYVDDGNLAIDNNSAERAIRGVAVGRKNSSVAARAVVSERP